MNKNLYTNHKLSRSTTICLFIWALHGLLLAFVFPLSELWSARPLLYIDSPFHLYQMNTAIELWKSHDLVGYDPWFAAGYIGGVSYNASAKMPALLAMIFAGSVGPIIIYKLYVFLTGLIAPGFVLLAIRLLNTDAISTVAAMLLGFLLWWISYIHWYHTAGMVAFVVASYASLPFIVLVWRTVTSDLSTSTVLVLCLYGAFGLLLHPLFPIPIIFASSFLVLTSWEKVNPRTLLIVLAVVPAFSLLLNITWILPSFHYQGLSDGKISPFQKIVDIKIVLSEAIGNIKGSAHGARLNPVIWLCIIWAVLPVTAFHLRRIAAGFVMGGISLAIFAAIGAWLPMLATMQPNRQSAAAYLLLTIPAAIGISTIARSTLSRGLTRYAAFGTVALLLAASIFFFGEMKNELSADKTPHYGRPSPEVTGEGDITVWLSHWIKHNTTADARILFETSPGRIYDNANISGYLVLTCQREFIGGPYVYMHRASFWDGNVFGRIISKFTAEAFLGRLRLYNIGWIVSHSAVSNSYLVKLPYLEERAKKGNVVIYSVTQQHSYFLEGTGNVTGRRINRIDLNNVDGDAVTLKYHYVSGLKTEPPLVIKPVLQSGDPIPFIKIFAPPRQLSIIYP